MRFLLLFCLCTLIESIHNECAIWYTAIIEPRQAKLARGSLYEIVVAQAHAGQKEGHKRRLSARES